MGKRKVIKLNLIQELKNKRKIYKMQEDYENGKILEKDMSEKEKQELIMLYEEQIRSFEEKKKIYEKDLETYKYKLLEKYIKKG